MLLLALETATSMCSVALWHNDHVAAHITLDRPRVHAEWLMPLVQDLLRYTGHAAGDLDAVALSAGPGSYTGLRIGASAAKGMCVALDVPLVPVPTLEALAQQAVPYTAPGDLILTAFDARRGHVYAALYRAENGALAELHPATALAASSLSATFDLGTSARIWALGDGARLVGDALPEQAVHLIDAAPSATTVAVLGARRFAEGVRTDLAAFEPNYVRVYTPKKGGSVFDKIPF